MVSAALFVGGGLLQGIGAGLAEGGKVKRERALADLAHSRNLERDTKNQGRRDARQRQIETDRKAAAGLTADAKLEAARLADDVAQKAAGKLEKSRRDLENLKTENEGEDQRAIALIRENFEKDVLGETVVTDRPGYSAALKVHGFKLAAQVQDTLIEAEKTQAIRDAAVQQAHDEAEIKDKVFGTEKSNFGGLTRAEWEAVRTIEIVTEGQTPATKLVNPTATEPVAPTPAATKPPRSPGRGRSGQSPTRVPDPGPSGQSPTGQTSGRRPYTGTTAPPNRPEAVEKNGFWWVKHGPGPKDWSRVMVD